MKDLITTIASIFLLMIFIMQFAYSQGTSHTLLQADMAVGNFRESVKVQGYISRENKEFLQRQLAEICSCSQEEIYIEGSSSADEPAERGTFIYYKVKYPLLHLIAMAEALGISDGDNSVYFKQEGWVVSSYEEPDYNHGNSESDVQGDSL